MEDRCPLRNRLPRKQIAAIFPSAAPHPPFLRARRSRESPDQPNDVRTAPAALVGRGIRTIFIHPRITRR